MRSFVSLVIYTIRFCASKGPSQTYRLVRAHLVRRLLRVFFDVTRIQVIAARRPTGTLPSSSAGPSVLFVYLPQHSSTLYRVTNQLEQLKLHGVPCASATTWDLCLLSLVGRYDVFIVHRVTDSRVMSRFVQSIRHQGKVSVYDIDDLDFEPGLLKHPNPVLREIGEANRSLLMKCDCVLTTTDYLAGLLRDKGMAAFINRNSLNLEQLRMSEEAFNGRTTTDRVRIGYISGTPTHDYDFLEATDALIRILEKYPSVDFYVAGSLELDQRFASFRGRISRLPYVHWTRLPFNIARIDVNLAPLEMDNPFTPAKSELKYFEAGILGIPTIASPVDAFKYAIKHGENGLLAANTEEWFGCLELLINDATLRRRIGENARQQVKDFYNPYYRGKQLVSVLEQIMRLKPLTGPPGRLAGLKS